MKCVFIVCLSVGILVTEAMEAEQIVTVWVVEVSHYVVSFHFTG